MKRLASLLLPMLIFWCPSAAGQQPAAYGTFKILGIGGQTTDQFVAVFASYLGDAYQLQYCAQNHWWWPTGTTHSWWLDRNDKTTVAIFLSAALAKSNMFISGYADPRPEASWARCRIWQYSIR